MIAELKRYWIRLIFTSSHQLSFIVRLTEWMSQGTPAGKALDIQISAAKNRRQAVDHAVAIELRAAIANGAPLHTGMKHWFRSELVTMVRLGQKSGLLAHIVTLQQEFWLKRNEIVRLTSRKLAYPAVLFIAAVIATVAIGQWIIPKFIELDSDMQWSRLTEGFVSLSKAIELVALPLILLFVGLAIVIAIALPRWRSSGREQLESFGIFQIYRTYSSVLVLQNISILLAGDMNLESACNELSKESGRYIAGHLKKIRNSLSQGETDLSRILDTGLLDEYSLFRVAVRKNAEQDLRCLFENLARDISAEAMHSLWLRVRSLIIALYVLSISLIILIVLSIGNVFTTVAGQWS